MFFSYFLIPLIFYFDFSKFWHFLFFRILKKQNAKFCFLFDYVLPVSRATHSCATIRLPRRRAYSRTLRRLAEIFKAACPAFERSQTASKKDCITRDRQPSLFLLTYLSGSYNCTFFHLLLAFVLVVRKIFSQSLFMIFVQTSFFLLHRCFFSLLLFLYYYT